MKNKLLLLLFLLGVVFPLSAQESEVLISTSHTSLLLSTPQGGELKFLYYGRKLTDADVHAVVSTESGSFSAYPVYGLNCPSESALSVQHEDGNMTLQMEVIGVETIHQEKADLTVISLKDKVYPFYVKLFYKAYQDVDVIEAWTEISHKEKKNVKLNQFASAYLPVRKGNVWLSSLYGAWANEARLVQEPLEPGMKVIKNKDGVRNSHTAHAEVMFSLDGQPRENSGRVIGAALCYGGNYKLRIDTDESEYHHFYAGINEDNSVYHLKSGEVFKTPELALTYSDEGLSGGSRNFHRWARAYKLANGDKLRKILLNSWEGVYFKINESGMKQMMAELYFLILSSFLNIVLDLFLIVVVKLGTAGAAYATIIAQGVSALLCFIYMFRKFDILKTSREDYYLDGYGVFNMLSIGIPMALNYSITAIGTMILQGAVNIFGSSVVAAFTAASKVENLSTQTMPTLGTAIATYCGQNLGAGKYKRIYEGMRKGFFICIFISLAASVICVLGGRFIVSWFVSNPSEEIFDYAMQYLNTISFFMLPLAWIFLYRNALQGLNRGLVPMLSGVVEMVCRIIVIAVTLNPFGYWAVRLASPITWLFTGILLIVTYFIWEKQSRKKHSGSSD